MSDEGFETVGGECNPQHEEGTGSDDNEQGFKEAMCTQNDDKDNEAKAKDV